MTINVKNLLEVELVDDNFLVVKETLSRMGIANYKTNTLTQSCGIFHNKNKYFIVHFKEMFSVDGKHTTFDETDRNRRNMIASMLERWNLIKIVNYEEMEDMKFVKIDVVPFKDRQKWSFVEKYKIGRK